MNEKINKLTPKVDQYFKNFDELNNRRVKWNTETKLFIENVLSTINNSFEKLVWHVGKNEQIKNLESVYWSMGNEMAGFSIKNKLVVRRPGYLNFAQLANGKIFIVISYPSIEENIREEIQPKSLGEFLPEEITEDLIYANAGIFLDEINDWTLNLEK